MNVSMSHSPRSLPLSLACSPAVLAVLALTCALLLGVAASVRIPLPWTPVPITLQTFVLYLSAALLSRHYATQMATWYLVLGLAGLPLFSGGSAGWGVLVGPRGGYLVGFILAATLIGYLQKRVTNYWSQVAVFFLASVVIFIFGASWLSFSMHLGFQQSLVAGVLPFIPGDIAKVLTAAAILHFGKRLVK